MYQNFNSFLLRLDNVVIILADFLQALGLNVDLGGGLSLAGGSGSVQMSQPVALIPVAIPPRSTAMIPASQEQLTRHFLLDIVLRGMLYIEKTTSELNRTI